MTHYDLMDRANRLFWKTFTEACAECLKKNPNAPEKEVSQHALEVADKAREEFVEESRSFTSA